MTKEPTSPASPYRDPRLPAIGHDIDDDFLAAMRPIGGVRPKEIDPTAEESLNADIVFARDDVIAEVKTLTGASRDAQAFEARLAKLMKKWVDKGLVPSPRGNRVKLNTRSLPEKCAHEMLRLVSRSVKTHTEKANAQIKSTKLKLKMPNARGLLVLCNTGNDVLTPEVVLRELCHSLRGQYGSVDWVIFMTYGMPIELPGMAIPADVFGPAQREGDFAPIDRPFLERVQHAWFTHIAQGQPMPVLRTSDHTVIYDAKHAK